MKIFNLSNADPTLPKYLQIAYVIRIAIRKGLVNAGERLPSVKALGDDLLCNRHTVMKAYGELIAEGWVVSQQRIGYLVAEHLPVHNMAEFQSDLQLSDGSSYKLGSEYDNVAMQSTQLRPSNQHTFRIVRQGSTMTHKTADEYQYNMAGGQPDLTIFPFSEFKSYMSDALSRPNVKAFGYGETKGYSDLIVEVSSYLRKSRGIANREILITNGSQEAMYIIAQLLLQSGDKVAVEALGYPPAFDAFKSAGATLVSIEQDHFGIIPTSLEHQISKGNVRLIYLTPLHQYPTTVTLSISRRLKIYQLAAAYNIPIIEDDYDHEFHYRCQPLPPMAVDDPKQLIIYVSTFSKVLFPGARIGFLAVSKQLARYVAEYRLLINHKNNIVMQAALANWMRSGGFERHIRRTTRVNQQRRDHAIALIDKSNLFECKMPDGGMALWIHILHPDVSASELADVAKSQGIFIQHENSFHVQRHNSKNCHIRIGFAGLSEIKFAEALQQLESMIFTIAKKN